MLQFGGDKISDLLGEIKAVAAPARRYAMKQLPM